MFWRDLFERLHISEIQYFLLDGQPPIVFQLLALNSIFMIYFIIRRMRQRGPQRSMNMTLQWVLIAINLGVLCQSNLAPYFHHIPRVF